MLAFDSLFYFCLAMWLDKVVPGTMSSNNQLHILIELVYRKLFSKFFAPSEDHSCREQYKIYNENYQKL